MYLLFLVGFLVAPAPTTVAPKAGDTVHIALTVVLTPEAKAKLIETGVKVDVIGDISEQYHSARPTRPDQDGSGNAVIVEWVDPNARTVDLSFEMPGPTRKGATLEPLYLSFSSTESKTGERVSLDCDDREFALDKIPTKVTVHCSLRGAR